jgi:hypothetical protein
VTDQAATSAPTTAPPSNALALASLVLGIIASGWGLVIGFLHGGANPLGVITLVWMPTVLPGLLAVIFGFIGVTTANRLNGRRKGLAIWGIVLGVAPVLVWFLAYSARTVLSGG